MKRSRVIGAVLAAGVLVWLGYRAYLAHQNLVTLNVRNMEIHRVVRKIEWQTWERILLNKNVGGAVTLNVHRVPLNDVLDIITLQTGTRWTALYPIYSARASEGRFEKVVRGELPAGDNGWSNFEKIPAKRWPGFGGFANTARAANNLVSAEMIAKDLGFAALALSRFSRALVIPEDAATGIINLKLEGAPFETAVAKVAKQAHRSWERLYAIQPVRQVIVAKSNVAGRTNITNNASATNSLPVTNHEVKPVMPPQPVPSAPPSPEDQARQMEAFLSTMSPEERQKAQEQITAMSELQTLPPAERQQRMQQIGAQAKQAAQADLEQRIDNRLRDGTVEQRLNHDRQVLQRKQQRAQKQ